MSDFITGLYVNKPNEKAPNFLKVKLSINVNNFTEWLLNNVDEKGYVKIDILETKDCSKYYAKKDTWIPNKEKVETIKLEDVNNQEEVIPDMPEKDEINIDDIPF